MPANLNIFQLSNATLNTGDRFLLQSSLDCLITRSLKNRFRCPCCLVMFSGTRKAFCLWTAEQGLLHVWICNRKIKRNIHCIHKWTFATKFYWLKKNVNKLAQIHYALLYHEIWQYSISLVMCSTHSNAVWYMTCTVCSKWNISLSLSLSLSLLYHTPIQTHSDTGMPVLAHLGLHSLCVSNQNKATTTTKITNVWYFLLKCPNNLTLIGTKQEFILVIWIRPCCIGTVCQNLCCQSS